MATKKKAEKPAAKKPVVKKKADKPAAANEFDGEKWFGSFQAWERGEAIKCSADESK